MIKRIEIYGGPGCGKSTAAATLFARLKNDGVNIELVTEYVKGWAWQGRRPEGFDQVYLFGKQMQREELPLRAGAIIITDSPLKLNSWYGWTYHLPGNTGINVLEEAFEKRYPSIKFGLDRADKEYNPSGRFQTKDEVREMDKSIFEYANITMKFNHKAYDEMYNYIKGNL